MKVETILISVLLLSAMAGFATSNTRIDGVAAYVNDHVITIGDVLAGSRDLQEEMARGAGAVSTRLNGLYAEALDSAISGKLILDEYETQKEIRIPEAMIDDRIETIVHNMFDDDRGALLDELGRDGLTMETWRSQIRERIIIRAMRNLRVDSKITVSPTDVRAAHTTEGAERAAPARINIRMIVLKKGDGESADARFLEKIAEVQSSLASGMEFAEAARTYSQGSRAEDGGDRGWMQADMLRDELAREALELEIGAISKPITLGNQSYILKVEDREDARAIPFEEAQTAIERRLRIKEGERLYKEWISHLKEKAYIKIIGKSPFENDESDKSL